MRKSSRDRMKRFLSTPSARRATACEFWTKRVLDVFLSTPSARRATVAVLVGDGALAISIHALCEEGDQAPPVCLRAHSDFYPRPLRGGRQTVTPGRKHLFTFLSTPSARRATKPSRNWPTLCGFLSTPSARRATLLLLDARAQDPISIHALCEEGDAPMCRSRPCAPISIHALCEEGDTSSRSSGWTSHNFYPRPLRGGRHCLSCWNRL